MRYLVILLLAISWINAAYAWKGYQVAATDNKLLATTSYTDVGLSITVTTTSVNERVLLIFSMVVQALAPMNEAKVTIYRGISTNIATTFLKRVQSKASYEIQPIVGSIVDAPGVVGTTTYTVVMKGDGLLSTGSVPRTFTAIVIANNYYYNQQWSSSLVPPTSLTSGMALATTLSQPTMRMLLLASMTIMNSTLSGDGSVGLTRGGTTSIGAVASIAYAPAMSVYMSCLDSPGVSGTTNYGVGMYRGAGSTYTMGVDNALNTFVAFALPSNQGNVATTSTIFTVIETAWRSIITVDITPFTSTDKILVMFNADQVFMDARATTACFTITRNGVNIGDPVYGITTMNAGAKLYARRSPAIMFLDSPGSATSVTYGISVKSIEGYQFQIGRTAQQTTLSVVIVSESYLAPTITPTAMPSTMSPTTTPIDCTATCAVMPGAWSINPNAFYYQYILPRYFTFTFGITVPSLATNNAERRNIFDFIDTSGVSLLSAYLTESATMAYYYNSILVVEYGPGLVPAYTTTATTIRITISYNQVEIVSSNDVGWTPVYTVSTVDTANKVYKLYISNEGDVSSRGVISNMAVTALSAPPTTAPTRSATTAPTLLPSRLPSIPPTTLPTTTMTTKPTSAPTCISTIQPTLLPTTLPTTLQPSVLPTCTPTNKPTCSPSTVKPTTPPTTKPSTTVPTLTPTSLPTTLPTPLPTSAPTLPTTDCRASCTLHAQQVVAVSAGNHIDNVLIPSSFALVFVVTQQTLVVGNGSPRRNFFEIVDTTSGSVLFSIAVTESRSPRISYGGNVLTEYGPSFTAAYASGAWTSYVVNVYPDRVTLASSVDLTAVFTYYTPQVDTADRVYALYASSATAVSAGGFIYQIQFSALTVQHSPPPTILPTLLPTTNPTTVTPTTTPTTTLPTLSPTLTPTLSPTLPPTLLPTTPPGAVDCRVSCVFANTNYVQITGNNFLAQLLLPPMFTMQFQLYGMSQPTAGRAALNVLDIQDSDGTRLFSMFMNGEPTPTFVYNNGIVTTAGPSLGTYQTGFVPVAVTVYNNVVTLSTAADSMIQTYSMNTVNTVGRIYNLYASNPIHTSSSGYLYDLRITGINPDPSRSPTTAPTTTPTKPTTAPTPVPTTFPSLSPVANGILDCTQECRISGKISVAMDTKLVNVFLSTHFKLTFSVMGQQVAGLSQNILTIIDNNGNILFSMSANSASTQFMYSNAVVLTGNALTTDAWTAYSVYVGPGRLNIISTVGAASTTLMYTYPRPMNNDNMLYGVYASNSFEDSAGGIIDNIVVTGYTVSPSAYPTTYPTRKPSSAPTYTRSPTTTMPSTAAPSVVPTAMPTTLTTILPTLVPTDEPTTLPTELPTLLLTLPPTEVPTELPTQTPTELPTLAPTAEPTTLPMHVGTDSPTELPTELPTLPPTLYPTELPTVLHTSVPSVDPTAAPTAEPTLAPSTEVTETPTTLPTLAPTLEPTLTPTVEISVEPTVAPTTAPSATATATPPPTADATLVPTVVPTPAPTLVSTVVPTVALTMVPTTSPTSAQTTQPSVAPSIVVRTVTATLTATSVYTGTTTANAMTITLDSAPLTPITVTLSTTTGTAFYPSKVVFSDTTLLSQSVALLADTPGTVFVVVDVSSSSGGSEEYRVVYTNGATVRVLDTQDAPLTPQLLSATFTSDGSAVLLQFSNPTDKGGYSGSFVCSVWLSFVGSESAVCEWRDASTIVIYPVGSVVLQLNSVVTLSSNSVHALCTASGSVCSNLDTVPATTVVVAAPPTRATPVLALVVPGVISSCSGLSVDLSGSTGSGGREWVPPTFTITTASGAGASGSASGVEMYLNQNFTMQSPVVVPNILLRGVSSVVISAKLCNFLGACGTASVTVSVVSGTNAIPVVSIAGLSVRTVSVSGGVLLTSSAYTMACNGTRSTNNLQYVWSVVSNGMTVPLLSDTADVSKFRVAPYTLKPLQTYTFTLSVTSSGSTTSTSVVVNVIQSALVAQIRGGSVQTIRAGHILRVDGTSTDPDSTATTLSYQWSCIQTNSLNTTCPLLYTTTSQAMLQLTAPVTAVGTTSTLAPVVTDGRRTATTQVSITVVESTAPLVSIESTPGSVTSINTANKLSLTGIITTQGMCSAVWSVDQSNVALATVALTPVTTLVPTATTRQVILVISANTLPARTVLTFTLMCGRSAASVQVTTNGPPLPGIFVVAPTQGLEISTNFLFSASRWTDPDLPLSYLFGFVSSSGTNTSLLAKSEATYGSSVLPAGAESKFEVVCFVKVFDTLEAVTSDTAVVSVKPNPDALNLLTTALSDSAGSVDTTKNAISLGGAVLNAVNCSAAPNCTSLHRDSCSTVANTCGVCVSGYVGESGSFNARCVSASVAGRRLTAATCTTDSDCGEGWEVCDKTNPARGVCAVPQKACNNDCFGHGTCVTVNTNSGKAVPDCRANNAACVAQCVCSEGYGGRDCSQTTAYLLGRQTLRASFMTSLATVLHNDDVNIATVSSWSDGLAALTQDPHELSARSAGEVSAFAQGILSVASTVADFSYESAVGVLDSLSAASGSVGASNSSAAGTLTTLAQFSDLVSSQIVSGQDSVEYWYDSFQLKSVKQFAAAGSAVEIITPTSGSDVSVASSVHVTPDTDDELSMNMISTSAASYGALGDTFNANPVQLSVTRASAGPTHAVFVLRHNAAVAFTSPQEAALMRLRTNCTGPGDRSVREFACPGSNELLVHNCSGHAAGVLTSYCPVLAPSCAVLNTTSTAAGGMSLNTNSTACVVVGHDAFSTTCNCTISPSMLVRRRLEGEVAQTGVLDVVSASIYLANEFVNTFDSADDLTSLEGLRRVLIVIVMFSTLWAAGILLILTCTGRRKIMEPKHKKSMEQIKEKLQKVEGAKTHTDVRRYLTNYVVEIFPSVFSNKPFLGRLYGEIKRHHRYLTLFTATEGATGDKERILTAVELLSVQTMLMFLLALLYDVQAPTDDNSCVTHLTQDSCLNRRSPFDNSQAYCSWQTPGDNAADFYCEYAQPEFSVQIVIYISVIVALLTAVIQYPLDQCMDLLSAPIADDLKLMEEENVVNKVGRRMSNVARRVSLVAANVATAAQLKLSATHKSIVGSLTRKIPESTEVAHSLATVSMLLIAESSQQSLRERELNHIRQFHQSGGRHQVYGQADNSDPNSDSDSASNSDSESNSDLSELESSSRRASKVVQARASQMVTADASPAGSVITTVDTLLLRLTEEVSCQRRLLAESDRELFDSQWGLDPTGEFCQGERSRVPFLLPGKPGAQQLIRGELAFVKSETAKKCDKLRVATDQHTGLEILHLFIMDLLGRRTPAARIFETKATEDFKHTKVVSKNVKRVAMVALVALNAFFVYYAMLTGYRRGLSWQRMYLMACIIQMVVEICLFETMECVWINCAVPILVSAEVRRVGDSILEVVQHMCAENKSADTSLFLNAPDYLFVSTNVAKKFPSLMESIVVQTYANHLPGELAKIWQVGSVARINRHQRIRDATVLASVLAGLQLLATAPFLIHRMFVRFSQPFVFSAFVLFWQLVVSNVIYLGVAVGAFVLLLAYGVYVYYLKPHYAKQNVALVAPIVAKYDDDEFTPPHLPAEPLRVRTASYEVPLNLPVLNSRFEAATSSQDEEEKSLSQDSADSGSVVHRAVRPAASTCGAALRAASLDSLSSGDLSDRGLAPLARKHLPGGKHSPKLGRHSRKRRPRLPSEESIPEEPERPTRHKRTPRAASALSASSPARARADSRDKSDTSGGEGPRLRGTHRRGPGKEEDRQSSDEEHSHSDSSSDASSD